MFIATSQKYYLRVVLCIPSMQCNRLQIQATIKIDSCDNISFIAHKPVFFVIQWITHCNVGTIPETPSQPALGGLTIGFFSASSRAFKFTFGKERLEGAMKACACAAVVGTERVSMMKIGDEG